METNDLVYKKYETLLIWGDYAIFKKLIYVGASYKPCLFNGESSLGGGCSLSS